jgi:tripartite-type tricarboxylate transporter receptor subunit TctC
VWARAHAQAPENPRFPDGGLVPRRTQGDTRAAPRKRGQRGTIMRILLVLTLLWSWFGASVAIAQSVADFYKGKTINLYVAFPSGGGYDIYSRLAARYMQKYVPGNPNIVTQNMPGAGGVKAANFLYDVAPRDGSAIGMIADNAATEEVLATPGVTYATAKFNWIGRVTSSVNIEAAMATSGFRTIEDVKQREFIVGGTGAAGITTVIRKVANAIGGTKFKVITGYAGSPESCLAMEKGEVQGCAPSWTHAKTNLRNWLDTKKINVILQWGVTRHRELADVPTMVELGKTDEDRKVLALYGSATDLGRSIAAPPGVPAERLKALRDAFTQAMNDPELLAEVKKANLDFDPMNGADLQKFIVELNDVSPSVIDRARKAHGGL